MTQFAHHIKALLPAIRAMADLGFNSRQCLHGTGISEDELIAGNMTGEFSLQQEFHFHRNLLELSGDPLLGLKLGRAYTLENYGLVGYAFLSAPTLRHAMTIFRSYGPLSFTLFKIGFLVEGPVAITRFSQSEYIPDELLSFYVDRDMSAALFSGEVALQRSLSPKKISLMHSGQGLQRDYTTYFSCPVTFDALCCELHFDAAILDSPMPLRDAETSSACQQQCQMLLARMSKSSGFVTKVRQVIVARPGFFPDIDFVAEKLNMTSRTLRRRLYDEGSSYQQILTAVRYQLACEYLASSKLPLEEISVLLGYSAPGNFTHAFKRWHGSSPRTYRKEVQ